MIEGEYIDDMGKDKELNELSTKFITDSAKYKYSYHFTWLGRPIIQFPQDIVSIQEIIWNIKPDLIMETGILYSKHISKI